MPRGDTESFTSEELSYYSRHLSLPDLGVKGQQRLKAAKVLVVGAGGLGVPLLQYLTGAGVGTIGIIDYDKVETSNLHRQVLYGTSDVGRSKVTAAKQRLEDMNPYLTIRTHEQQLTSDNALNILADYDVIADGTDNFPTRYLVNDTCVMLDKPFVQGSIFQFTGQLSVFNYREQDGSRGPNYRDLFPEPPPPGSVPNCAEAGVLGVLPGIIGSLQANEVIKLLAGIGTPLSGKLFMFDAKEFSTRTVDIMKDRENPLRGEHPEITELIDYQAFCGIPSPDNQTPEKELPEVSVSTYKYWLESNEKVQLIDVREPFEKEIADLGGDLIPLKTLPENIDRISRKKKVVVHCRSGKRSAEAVELLRDKYNFDNVYNLEGGILAWADEIDEDLPKY